MNTFLQSFFLVLITISGLQAIDSNPIATSKVKSEVDSILSGEKDIPRKLVSEAKNQSTINTIECHDTTVLYVYPGFPKEIQRNHVLDYYTSSTSGIFSAVITCEDEFGQEYPDNIFSFDEIGSYIIGRATLLSNGNTCTTRILLDSCPFYQACDTLCGNFPGVECEDGLFSQLKWPCDITLTNCIGPSPHTYTPARLAEITGLDLSSFLPQLNNLECQAVEMYFGDEIMDTPDSRLIRRTFRVFIPDMNEWRYYTQEITVPFIPLGVCDFLPRDTPLGDCLSGHTSTDMVEWPADLEVIDTIISLSRLESAYLYGLVPGYENIKPNFENVCAVPEIRYEDKLKEISDTSNIFERTWTVIDPVTDEEYSYVQTINQILFYKAEICISNPLGERISNIDLEILNSSNLDSIYYNDSECIELRMKRIPAREFTIFADSLGIEKGMEGVNIVDVVAIRDHYEKTKLFDSKLSEIAAHFGSGVITSYTMVKMLRAITGYPDEVESAHWAVVDSTLYNYPIQNSEYSIYSSTVTVNDPNADLILIKKGDVNFSEIMGENTEGEFKISIQDEIINVGESYQIDFLVSSDTDLRAFQVEFNVFNENADQIFWTDVPHSNVFQSSPENSVFQNKQIVVRRYGYGEPIEKKEGDTLFSLEFRALKNGVLSEMLTLYPSENNLAVMPVGQLPMKIVLDWKDKIINSNVHEVELEKIALFPNPASEYLEIRGITSVINYQITDMLGKVSGSGIVSEDASLNVENLNSGMYVLTMINESGARKSFKFFVAK